jgi:uncharacterized protein (DUF4415 family)
VSGPLHLAISQPVPRDRAPAAEQAADHAASDLEIFGWFKRTGKGYQSRIGAVLRSYVDAKRKRG